jgi:pyruvate, water dikinase
VNVLLADQFAQVFDGFSIGSNDLTQLTLGIDRDSEIVSHLFDEQNKAVKEMIAMVIHKAKLAGVKVGLCGQAPSDFPEFAGFLVEQGIDSISFNQPRGYHSKKVVFKPHGLNAPKDMITHQRNFYEKIYCSF